MKNKIKLSLPVLVMVFIVGFFSGGCGREVNSADGASGAAGALRQPAEKSAPPAADTVSSREPAPLFTLNRFNSEDSFALKDLRGKPVFLDFWASWCPPCRKSTPYVKRLREEFGDKIHIVGISLDRDRAAAAEYIEKENLAYTQLEGAGSRVPGLYNVRGIPTFYIIDSGGGVVKSYSGFTERYFNEWMAVIKELLDI